MYEKIKEKYYWKNMFEDIKAYAKTCNSCQKRGKSDKKNELFLIKNKYIIVAIDYFTKWPEAKATEKDNAETVTEFMRKLYADMDIRRK
ncbi:uncharacterized protein K02A2.6-like [Rhizophagus clarus]|uniref:Uncharacterized protein K02A2.6-like n=1 Tax=Rhizophagus clarus TaxID=94130 RepID=A0A8H3R648_9GLOM|nr:uncharacterized protein K02A2.6-like [Rhizophagus clarus]